MDSINNESKMKVVDLKSVDQLKYLHSFTIDYKTKSGAPKQWELVSRQGKERLENEIFKGASYTDGAIIFATNKERDRVVILKEFRVSAGKYMYMFPAGLIEQGEDILEAGAREFKEETGMGFESVMVERERYVSVGIINEKVNVVYGYFSGEPSQMYQDDNEDAEILIVNKEEAKRILEEEEVSIRTAMLLQGFFNLNPFFDA